MKKILIIVCVFLGVLLLAAAGVGVWAYGEFLHTEPLTDAELAELTTDWDEVTGGNWSPWYDAADGTKEWNPAASYNAWAASVPEEEKAWPVLIALHHDYLEPVFQNDLYLEYAGTLPHHRERWERLRELMESDSVVSLTAGLEEAVSRAVIGCELLASTDPYQHAALIEHGLDDHQWDPNPPENQSLMEVIMQWLGETRTAAQILQGRAALALEDGDPDGFVRLVEAIDRASDLNADMPVIIGRLVEIAIDTVNQETIAWALTAHGDQLEEAHLERLAEMLYAQAEAEFDWNGERLMFHDAVRRMTDETGAMSPQSLAGGVPLGDEPFSLPVTQMQPSAQRILLVHERLLEQARLLGRIPWDQQLSTTDEVMQEQRDGLNYFADKMLDILIPAFDKASARVRMFRQQTAALQTAIAAHRHHLRHGEFPESLDAIDTDLLTIDPIDAFTGEPLRYRLTETGPLIYSVGDDRVDDGGMIRWEIKTGDTGEQRRMRTWPQWHTTEEAARLLDTDPDAIHGDWVLFPIPVSDPEPIEEEYDPDWDLHNDG